MEGFLSNDCEALTTKLLESLQSLMDEPKLIRSISGRRACFYFGVS